MRSEESGVDTPGMDGSEAAVRPTVLVVDDDRTMRMFAEQALGAAGFAVETAVDGEAALALLDTFRPDLILLDVLLPGIDGIALCRQLRAAPATRDIPICIMTGLDRLASVREAFEAGATDFVIKPPSWPILIQHLRHLLRSSLMSRDLAAANARLQREISEHERTEQVLLIKERAIDSSINAMAMSDLGGRLTYVNTAFLKMWDCDNENDVLGRPVVSFWDSQDQASDVAKAVLADGGWVGEMTALKRSGARFDVQLSAHLVTGKDGSPTCMMASFIEISDRKRTEKALRESEERLRLALMAANQGLYDLNTQTGETLVSPEYARMLGYEPDEFVESNARWRERLHEDDRENVCRVYQEYLAGVRGEYRVEFRQRTKAGGWKWILSLGKVVERDREGRPLRMLGTHTDITERKRDEAELRKLSQAVEQSANIIIVTDVEGRIEYVNPRFVQNSGYSLAEALGQTPRLVKSGEHSPEFYKELWETIKAGKVWKGELHNRRKDGTLYWEDTTITPILDPAGKLVNFMAVKEDVTARKALEQAEGDQRRLAEALRDSAAALNSTLKLEEVLDRILESIGKTAVCDAVFMVMLEGDEARLVRQRGMSLPRTGGAGGQAHYRLADLPLLGPLLESRLPCLIADTGDDPTCASGCRMVPGTRSCLGLPLAIRGNVVGAIVLTSTTPGHFSAAVVQRLGSFANQASVAIDNARLFQRAHHLSVTDSLTGLINRRHFFDVAKVEYERTRRHGRPLSLAMIDLDHFKNLNDRWGHLAGDAALSEVARRVKETLRTIDVVARYGGEEFVVLMPETDLAEALLVAERVCLSVAQSPVVEGGVTVATTVSVGVAEVNEQCASLEDVLKCADQALYAAKAAGRNRVEAYHCTQ